jgi:hypothetical protein
MKPIKNTSLNFFAKSGAVAAVLAMGVVPAARALTFDMSTLVMNPTATADLGTNALIVRTTSYATIVGYVTSGFNAGSLDGFGINSSTAAGEFGLTAIGVIDNAYVAAADFGPFTGLNQTETLARYTYAGDTNLDGVIDGADFSNIDNGFAFAMTDWFNGDLNYDGVIDGADFSTIDNNFAFQGPPLFAPGGGGKASGVVPEPGATGLILVGLLGILGRRRLMK